MPARIKLLIALHVVTIVACAFAAPISSWQNPPLLLLAFIAVIFADAGIIGLWAAHGKSAPRRRSAVVIAALFALWWGLVEADGYKTPPAEAMFDALLMTLTTASVFIVMRWLKTGKKQLSLKLVANSAVKNQPLQFSIRHLFVGTAIVAVVVTAGKIVRANKPTGNFWDYSVITAVLVPSFVLVQLMTTWAALGTARPGRRLAAVVPASFMLGLIPPLFMDKDVSLALIIWPCIIGCQSVIVAFSLLVVRSCRWRLCRDADADQKRADVVTISDNLPEVALVDS